MSMPRVDPRQSAAGVRAVRMWHMDILLVLILIAVMGLFAQAVGTDSRDFNNRAA